MACALCIATNKQTNEQKTKYVMIQPEQQDVMMYYYIHKARIMLR